MRRSKGLMIFAIIVGAIIGSALTHIIGWIFPAGPVRSFFFKSLRIGFSDLKLSLGFIAMDLSLWFNISIMTIVAIFVTIYLLRRL